MNNLNFGMKHTLEDEAGGVPAGGGAPAGGAPAGGAPAGGQPAGGVPAGGQPQGPFADANAARGFLKDYVPGEDYLKAFDDTKVMPFAAHLKTKFDDMGKAFPADWRKMVAGDSPEHLKTLDRFATPKALYESYNTLRAKLSSGELKPVTAFPDKGTAEEQASWRSINGVPNAPEEYLKDFKLPKGVKEMTEDDKSVFESLTKTAHARHLPTSAVHAQAEWFLAEKQARAEKRAENDGAFREQSEDLMRAEWGNDYRANTGRIGALLDTGPAGIRDLLAGARLQDGTKLGDHPDWLRFFADVSRQLIPGGVVITDGANIGKSVADEIASIEKTMKTNRKAYDKDESMQKRLRELYSARDRLGKKAA